MLGDLDPVWARSLLSSLRSGLLAVDAELRVMALSGEGARILGLDEGTVVGRPLAEVLPDQAGLRQLIADALSGRDTPSRAEWTLEEGGAVPRIIGFTLTPVRREGAVIGASLLFRDLTSFERADERRDRRRVFVSLTDRGRRLARKLEGCADEYCERILERVPKDRREDVVHALRVLVEAIDELPTACD